MSNMFEKAAMFIARNIERSMSTFIEYRRGNETIEIKAAIGRSAYEVENGDGMIVRVHSRDFIVLASSLFLGGAVTQPRRGDRIVETNENGMQLFHEVVSIGNAPEWDYADVARQTVRVHTKQVV